MPEPQRGEVWLVDLGLAAKVRPCLVLSVPVAEQDRALMAVAPSPQVGRRHCGPWRRQGTPACWPRRSGTGARPAYVCRSVAEAERSRGSPQATRRRAAKPGSAPRSAWHRRSSGGLCARRAGGINGGKGLHGDPELGAQGLDEHGLERGMTRTSAWLGLNS
jgi:hypothetical protein